ncbi:MAG: hypothetical protein KA765_08665 [Thermoflexales bacterium]|nr:hypothetical protein [Thermoflexales bacterium]
MGHAITVDVPPEAYESLANTARQTGQTPEELAALWLTNAARQVAADPLERFIGAITTQIPDWAERHDHYLGRALKDALSESEYGEE